jgi:hypothetical protein
MSKPLAEKTATWEREIGSDPRDDVRVASTAPEMVPEDTLIARPDLGDTTYTFVAAGDATPTGLEGNKRSPAGRRKV